MGGFETIAPYVGQGIFGAASQFLGGSQYEGAAEASTAAAAQSAMSRQASAEELGWSAKMSEWNREQALHEGRMAELSAQLTQALTQEEVISILSQGLTDILHLAREGSAVAGSQVAAYSKAGVEMSGSVMDVMKQSIKEVGEDKAVLWDAMEADKEQAILAGNLESMQKRMAALSKRYEAVQYGVKASSYRTAAANQLKMIPWDIYQGELGAWEAEYAGYQSQVSALQTLMGSGLKAYGAYSSSSGGSGKTSPKE